MTSLLKHVKPFVAIIGLFFYVVLHLWLPICTVALAENVDDSSLVTVKCIPFGYKKLTIKLFEEPETRLGSTSQSGLQRANETHILLPHRCNGLPHCGDPNLATLFLDTHFLECPRFQDATHALTPNNSRPPTLFAKPPPNRLQALRAHETIVLRI